MPYVLKEFFDVKDGEYETTPFNIIRLAMYQGRSMVMGGRAGAKPTPVKPWCGRIIYFFISS
jgi:hypothetical protein